MFDYKVQKKLVDLDLLNKFDFNKSINIPKLGKIYLSVNLNGSEFESNLLNVKLILALEILCLQKPFIKKKQSLVLKGKQSSSNLQSVLRGNSMFSFLYFFQMFIYKQLKEKFIFINKEVQGCNYFFSIRDLSVFPGLSENFVYSKVFLHFLLVANNIKKKEELSLILRNYCFSLV